MVSPLAMFSALLVTAFTWSLNSSFESKVMPSHFMVPWWDTMISPSGPGRVMLGKMALCCLVKCVSSHLTKSIERPRPSRMPCIVMKMVSRVITFSCRLVEEVYVLTSSM